MAYGRVVYGRGEYALRFSDVAVVITPVEPEEEIVSAPGGYGQARRYGPYYPEAELQESRRESETLVLI